MHVRRPVSTWKEEERPELTVTTRLSNRGDFSMTGIPQARNLNDFERRARWRIALGSSG